MRKKLECLACKTNICTTGCLWWCGLLFLHGEMHILFVLHVNNAAYMSFTVNLEILKSPHRQFTRCCASDRTVCSAFKASQ